MKTLKIVNSITLAIIAIAMMASTSTAKAYGPWYTHTNETSTVDVSTNVSCKVAVPSSNVQAVAPSSNYSYSGSTTTAEAQASVGTTGEVGESRLIREPMVANHSYSRTWTDHRTGLTYTTNYVVDRVERDQVVNTFKPNGTFLGSTVIRTTVVTTNSYGSVSQNADFREPQTYIPVNAPQASYREGHFTKNGFFRSLTLPFSNHKRSK
ncbi:MAG: hypothetical protein JWO73_895 [Candidatus Taylorbacteria bacterium]|nr:hypothetical protein [Candidatus Taylorbacteria bacterium]